MVAGGNLHEVFVIREGCDTWTGILIIESMVIMYCHRASSLVKANT